MRLVDVAHSLDEAAFPGLDALRERYGWSERDHRIFDRLFGLRSTSIHEGVALREALEISARELARRHPDLRGQVDVLVYCHALNTALPPEAPALAEIAEEVFASRPEVLSLTQGSCASAILATELLRGRPGEAPRNVVMLTGEKCFFELLDYAPSNGLFGETTSCAWLRTDGDGPGARVAAVVPGRFEGVWSPVPQGSKAEAARYDAGFVPLLEAAARAALERAGTTPEEVDLVLPTHLSPFTFDRVAARLGIDPARICKRNLRRIGHCFCGDLLINYGTWAADHAGAPARILSFAAGMTGSYAAIVLHKEAAA